MRRVLGLAIAMLLAGSGTAWGATVQLSGDTLSFTAAPGEVNDLVVGSNPTQGSSDVYYFRENGRTLAAPAGCTSDIYDDVVCPRRPNVTVDLGDQDDKVSISIPGAVKGGDGNDSFSPTATSDGPRTLDGGNGDDTFNGDRSGGDCFGASGPASADTMIGGGGTDTVRYEYGNVTASLDGQPGDGKPGENDNIGTDIETFVGAVCGGNAITGNDGPNKISAYGTINGLGGDDQLTGGGGSQADTLNGGDGNDKLMGLGGNDTLDGGNGDDFLEGGFDDDVITGGPGTDSFAGDETASNTIGTGNDTINADDGVRENVSCGPGADIANLDAVDVPAVDPQNGCETIRRSGVGAGGLPGGGGAGTSAPSGPAAALVKASGAKLLSRRRKLRITVTCNAPDKAGCNGRVSVFATRTGKKKVALASKSIGLAQGKRATYTLKIGAKGRSLIKHTKKKSVPLQVVATLRTSAGNKTVTQKLSVKR